jgi:hypothetical protein
VERKWENENLFFHSGYSLACRYILGWKERKEGCEREREREKEKAAEKEKAKESLAVTLACGQV